MDVLFLIGRIIVGGFYLFSAANHLFMGRDMLTGYAESKGVPAPGVAVLGSGLLLLIGGLSFLLGVVPTVGVAVVVLFFLGVSPIMHNFWAIEDQQQQATEMTQFLKNMALMGAALMFLMIDTPWPLSLGG